MSWLGRCSWHHFPSHARSPNSPGRLRFLCVSWPLPPWTPSKYGLS
jgi:hypothetical protein